MQLAILCVLVLIAVLMAPWLLGVLIALAAAYGIWLTSIIAVIAGVIFCGYAWKVLSGRTEAGRARRIARIAKRSNVKYSEKTK